MPRYKVQVRSELIRVYVVKAEDQDEAEDLVYNADPTAELVDNFEPSGWSVDDSWEIKDEKA